MHLLPHLHVSHLIGYALRTSQNLIIIPHLHVSHQIGYTLSTSQNLINIPHLHVSHLIGYSLSTSQNPIIIPQARQYLGKRLYCICTHWLFDQTYAWWPAVVSATLQRHMWLPT